MPTIRSIGEIKEVGTLDLNLPDDFPTGKVQVTIETTEGHLTDEEIKEFMRVEPMTGAEIVVAGLTDGWEEMGITDSVEWLQEQRNTRRKSVNYRILT
jgi:hypothetical protein